MDSAHPITARTALCAIVLHPARHTRSPAMHNAAVLTHLGGMDPVDRRIGAVNTVTLRDGRLMETNTDRVGAMRAFERADPAG